jgi:hypothetical protein
MRYLVGSWEDTHHEEAADAADHEFLCVGASSRRSKNESSSPMGEEGPGRGQATDNENIVPPVTEWAC